MYTRTNLLCPYIYLLISICLPLWANFYCITNHSKIGLTQLKNGGLEWPPSHVQASAGTPGIIRVAAAPLHGVSGPPEMQVRLVHRMARGCQQQDRANPNAQMLVRLLVVSDLLSSRWLNNPRSLWQGTTHRKKPKRLHAEQQRAVHLGDRPGNERGRLSASSLTIMIFCFIVVLMSMYYFCKLYHFKSTQKKTFSCRFGIPKRFPP